MDMKAAILDGNNVVTNIVVADPEFAQSQGWVVSDTAKIGRIYQGGEFVDPPVDLEALAEEVRAKRDRLLAESDWTQVADAPVDQTAWATYRQALRDIPDQQGFPENVEWPVKPA
jgi:hypothetical protein